MRASQVSGEVPGEAFISFQEPFSTEGESIKMLTGQFKPFKPVKSFKREVRIRNVV